VTQSKLERGSVRTGRIAVDNSGNNFTLDANPDFDGIRAAGERRLGVWHELRDILVERFDRELQVRIGRRVDVCETEVLPSALARRERNMIFLPSISRSPRTRSPTRGSMLTIVPPLSRMRCLGSGRQTG
jgi:hypothetical protein